MALASSRVEELSTVVHGDVIGPDDPRYDEARRVYNGMIDKRPGVIIRCADVADVIAAVNLARESGLPLAVRGGGHNPAGLGTCDDGVVADLSPMRGVRVDPKSRTARVAGGATLADMDHATHPFGLAVPAGVVASTGVGGITLGGGLGHLTRKYGLTIDNLLEVDLVLADGSVVTASENENPDLFWAVRGGGGNFGVATSFLFQAHPVSMITGGLTLWPMEQAADVLKWYREFSPQAQEDLCGTFASITVPPAPPFPDELHLQKMCGVLWCYSGPQDQADEAFRPVQEFKPAPALWGVQPMPFPMLQGAFDPLYPAGLQWYWRSDSVKEISDEAVDMRVKQASQLPTMLSAMFLHPVDGAAQRVPSDATAYSFRDTVWSETILGVDPDPANAERIISWTRETWEALHPHSAGGAYVNFMGLDEGKDRVQASYRDNYPRLAAIKAKYDPGNLFRINHNISPNGSG